MKDLYDLIRPASRLVMVVFLVYSNSAGAEKLNILTGNNQILVVDSSAPQAVERTIAIQGVGDDMVVGIDYRPSNRQLYAVTSNQKVYQLDPVTGEASVLSEESFADDMPSEGYGWDFNPAVDRIRWVTAEAVNRRVHPESGSLVAADSQLAYAINDSGFGLDPVVTAVGYDDEANLFAIDAARDQFVSVSPANDGVLHSIGALGVIITGDAGLDVSSGTGAVFAAMQVVGEPGASLFQIQRSTGAAFRLGTIAGGDQHILSLTVEPPPAVDPAVYTVTTLSDTVGEDGLISLREALMAANSNTAVFEAPAGKPGTDAVDVIRFSGTLADEPLILNSGSLVISDSVRIESAPETRLVLTTDNPHRILEITPDVAEVTLDHLTISNGSGVDQGGGLLIGSGARVELMDVIFENCSATDGGAIFVDGGHLTVMGGEFNSNTATGQAGSGGGIFLAANGSATLVGTSFAQNEADRAGGGIEDQSGPGLSLVLENVIFLENKAGRSTETAAPGNGGGIHITGPGDSSIKGGRLEGNYAAREGGGLWNGSGHMEVHSVTLVNNRGAGAAAHDGGGAIFNNGGSMTIIESTMTENIADGASGSGGAILSLDGLIHVEQTIMSANQANRAGGAIELVDGELRFIDSQMGGSMPEHGNIAGPEGMAAPGNGGGLHVTGSAVMSISGSIVQNNFAAREGGGLWNQSGSTMTVSNGTVITDNTAAGNEDHDGGGGIFNNGGVLNLTGGENGPVTVSGNQCIGTSGLGAGILSIGGPAIINGVTMSGNTTMAMSTIGSVENTGSGIVQVDSELNISMSSISDDIILRNAMGILSGETGGSLLLAGTSQLRTQNSPSEISASDLGLGNESLLDFRLGELNSDRISVSGDVVLAGARLQGEALDGFMPSAGETFRLIDNKGSNPVMGEFTGQPEGSFMWVGLNTYRLSYKGGDGNDVTLSVSGIPGQVNVGINNTATINPETGLFEQSVLITNNTGTRQTGIGVFVSDLPPGIEVANGDGIRNSGSQMTPFQLLDRELNSGEQEVITFAFNNIADADTVAPTYTVKSREDIPGVEQITNIQPLIEDQVLLEFESVDQEDYAILYSDDLKTWKKSAIIKGQGELTQWLDPGPPVTETPLSSQAPRFYQAQRQQGTE